MADITQRLVVKVDYEGNLKSGIDEVKQLGKVAEDDVKAFQSLQKEINAGINDALQEAGVSMKDFAEASKKATDPTQFKSLKQQIREAKDEATALAAKFGDTSKQAIDAQKKVAKLTDELGDFNDRVKALNPDAKFNAVNQTLQGTIGAFQGITGAAQLFGAENKALNETLMKMQGLLNLTQGVNSVMQLKDAFTNLRVVLGLTAVAEEGVTVATNGMTAALSATGIGLVAIAVGALVYSLSQADDEMTKLKETTEDWIKLVSGEKYDYNKAIREQVITQLQLLNQVTKGEAEIMRLQQKRTDNIAKINKEATDAEKKIWELRKEGQIRSDREADDEIVKIRKNRRELIGKADELYNLEKNNILLKQDIDAEEERKKKVDKKHLENIKKRHQEEINIMLPIEQKKVEAQLAIDDKYYEDASDRDKRLARERMERMQRALYYFDQSSAIAGQLSSMLHDQSIAQYQAEESALNDQLRRKEISQKQYDSKLRAIKRKQAEDDKKYALFNAFINAAGAILNALNTKPPEAVPAAVAYASVLSALNIGAIIARPIPKFAKGSLFVNGGNGGVDDIPAYLNKGEAVIPTHTNKAYAPAIDAIYHNKIHPSVLNAFVHAHKSGKTSNSMIANMELMRAVKGNGTVNVRNASDLAKMIGAEVANNLNHRRR